MAYGVLMSCDWNSLSDEDLCLYAQQGDADAEDALARRYVKTVRSIARPYFLTGGDGEDLTQEGMLGFLSAVRNFTPDRGSFQCFAEICIMHRVYSAIRSAHGKKHTVLTQAVSIEHLEEINSYFLSAKQSDDPEFLFISREEQTQTRLAIRKLLSGFENRVLSLYLKGLSYQEMAKSLNRPVKSVDNCVQRIRRKLCHLKIAQ